MEKGEGYLPGGDIDGLSKSTVPFRLCDFGQVILDRCFMDQQGSILPSIDQGITWHCISRKAVQIDQDQHLTVEAEKSEARRFAHSHDTPAARVCHDYSPRSTAMQHGDCCDSIEVEKTENLVIILRSKSIHGSESVSLSNLETDTKQTHCRVPG